MNEVYDALRKANAAGDKESVAKLVAYINSQESPEEPSLMDQALSQVRPIASEALRQVGLTARAAGPVAAGATIGGMLGGPPGAAVGSLGVGLGQMVGDPLVALYNRATGSSVATPSQSMENLMTSMGLPEPKNAQERIVQDITRAAASTIGAARGAGQMGANILMGRQMAGQPAGIAPEVFNLLSKYPAQQVSGAALAAGAGGALREGDIGTGGQILGSMAAGMVAPGGPKTPLMSRTVNIPKSLVQPFTQEGREVMVGNVLRNVATDPERAIANLQAAQPTVPGVKLTTAAGARDPGLAGLESPLRSATFDPSNMFGARLSANQQALMDAYRRLGGRPGDEFTPGSIPYAEAKRESVAGPLREQAFAGVTVEPETFQRGVNLVVNRAIDNVMASPVGVRQDVEVAMKFAADRIKLAKNPQELYEVRKDLAGAAQGKYNQENPSLRLAKGQLNEVIRSVDDVIEAAAPGYKKYMDQYKKSSSAIDQMNILQGIESKVTTGQTNIVTNEPVLMASKLRTQLAAKKEEIGADLSPAAQRKLDNIINEINRGQAATAPGVRAPGSNTFQNMSMGNLIGRVFSESLADNTTLRTMTRPLDWLYKLPDQQVQRLLVEAMLDPQLAAVMMSKANMMKVEPLSTALRQKAIQLGMGTAIGANQ